MGCASSHDTSFLKSENGTFPYPPADRPQTGVAGEGSLMPGAYNSRDVPTGQFTGKERTEDAIGQPPALPRDSDARQVEHSAGPTVGAGAGTLGQAGIVPEPGVVSSVDISQSPRPTVAPSASDIQRSGEAEDLPRGVGSAPEIEVSTRNAVTNNATIPTSIAEDKARANSLRPQE
jgi:hypothetical protein